jgi:hypothetical protein
LKKPYFFANEKVVVLNYDSLSLQKEQKTTTVKQKSDEDSFLVDSTSTNKEIVPLKKSKVPNKEQSQHGRTIKNLVSKPLKKFFLPNL